MSDRRDRDWFDPRFLVALGAFLLTCAVMLFTSGRSVAATQLAVGKISGIDEKLKGIDEKLNTMALANSALKSEQDYQKRESERRDAARIEEEAKLWQISREHMAYIEGMKDRLIRLETKLGIK